MGPLDLPVEMHVADTPLFASLYLTHLPTPPPHSSFWHRGDMGDMTLRFDALIASSLRAVACFPRSCPVCGETHHPLTLLPPPLGCLPFDARIRIGGHQQITELNLQRRPPLLNSHYSPARLSPSFHEAIFGVPLPSRGMRR